MLAIGKESIARAMIEVLMAIDTMIATWMSFESISGPDNGSRRSPIDEILSIYFGWTHDLEYRNATGDSIAEDDVEKNTSLESGGGDDKSIPDKRQRRGDKRFCSIPGRSDGYGGFEGGFGV